MKEKLQQIVKFTPAFDKRHTDPKKDYGIGAVKCFMILKGKKGAVQFVFSTGMFLPKTHRKWLTKFPDHDPVKYMGFDVGYHSPVPQFKGQSIAQEKCEWLNNKPCYYDGSSLRAEEFMKILVKKGSDKIWEMLEQDYKEIFK